MRRKLDLAMTLVGDPRVIFLDEPTAGLDPRTRRTMWQIIRDLVSDGVTIFLSTQYLEEADELADRIVLLDHGRLVAEGTADELKQMIPGGHIRLQFADQAMLEVAERVFAGSARNDEALALQVPSDGSVKSLRAVLDYLDLAAIDVAALSVHTPRPRRRLPRDDRPASRGPGRHANRNTEGDRTMSTVTDAARDSRTMLRRNLRRMVRYPSLTLFLIGGPIIFLLIGQWTALRVQFTK